MPGLFQSIFPSWVNNKASSPYITTREQPVDIFTSFWLGWVERSGKLAMTEVL